MTLALKFLDDIPIDINNTLLQLLGRFQSVKDGLPELLKNAKDQYSRLGETDKGRRVIVTLINSTSHRIAVLDFAGATKADFQRWQTWSDPAANLAEKASDIEGGHGNGGKAFMVRGSTAISFLESCAGGHRTKMGFQNDVQVGKLFFPAYFIEDGKSVDDVAIPEVQPFLLKVLRGMGTKFNDLPSAAREAYEARNAFTVAQVNGVRDWDGRRGDTVRREIAELPKNIVSHAQAALTIETCSVFLVVDGVCRPAPLVADNPEAFPGFERPLIIPVPPELTDPRTGDIVPTGTGAADSKYLELRTSRRSLRMEETRPLNVIRVRNGRNVVDNWSVADLHSRAESAYIFGNVWIPEFVGDYMVGADRTGLADKPLVRAVRHWVGEQVEALAERIGQATAKEHKAEDRNKANEGLRKLRDLMREFLQVDGAGIAGPATGWTGPGPGPGITPPPPPPPVEYGHEINEIILEGSSSSIALAKGTRIPIVFRAYEIDGAGDRKLVKNVHCEMRIEGTAIAELGSDGQLSVLEAGQAQIWLVHPDTGVESNKVALEVVDCSGAEIRSSPERLLLQGERVTLRVAFNTAGGLRSDLLIEGSVDEPNMGRINRNGAFTAGGQEGTATIRIRYGAASEQTVTQQVRVGPDRIPHSRGGPEGGELPLILLCGTEVPGMEHYPPDQRTVPAAEHLPTIIDYEPQFENVIFLNPDSKESIQVRRGKGGRKGVMGIGTESFLQFLALKTFEIVKRLYVRQSVKDSAITEQQFRGLFADAEMQCAPFIDRAYLLARELTGAEVEAARA